MRKLVFRICCNVHTVSILSYARNLKWFPELTVIKFAPVFRSYNAVVVLTIFTVKNGEFVVSRCSHSKINKWIETKCGHVVKTSSPIAIQWNRRVKIAKKKNKYENMGKRGAWNGKWKKSEICWQQSSKCPNDYFTLCYHFYFFFSLFFLSVPLDLEPEWRRVAECLALTRVPKMCKNVIHQSSNILGIRLRKQNGTESRAPESTTSDTSRRQCINLTCRWHWMKSQHDTFHTRVVPNRWRPGQHCTSVWRVANVRVQCNRIRVKMSLEKVVWQTVAGATIWLGILIKLLS